MKRAFTLIELVVAVALLAIMISFSGVIFRVSITAQRTASANAEIMQKLRAVTDQLNSDLKGLRRDAPLLIWFRQDPNDRDQRYDQIMFFSDGDFQSTQLYDVIPPATTPRVPALTGTPVRGNVARIYYGQANCINYAVNYNITAPYWDFRTLARRCHILTLNPNLIADPKQRLILFPDAAAFVAAFVPFVDNLLGNNIDEHDSLSLAEWKVISAGSANNDRVIETCFDNSYGRPKIDFKNVKTLHMLMSEGVGSFQIQWAYWYSGPSQSSPALSVNRYLWWPSIDPDGDGIISDSDFGAMFEATGFSEFGIFFNMPGGVAPPILNWYGPAGTACRYVGSFGPSFFPAALKFTFTLYDSKGVIEGGRRFTHIIYLD